MEDVMVNAGDVVKELKEAEKLSAKPEEIISLTAGCGEVKTWVCC